MVKAYRYAVISLVLITAFCFPARAAVLDVVVLHSTVKPTPWSDEVDAGLAESLLNVAAVIPVYLGTADQDDDHFETQFEALARQWKGQPPLAVIADGTVAFAFMRKYREDLFEGTPVVYCGMIRPSSSQLAQCGDCTGIPVEYAVEKTIDLIFEHRPKTSVVVGITDGSSELQGLRERAEAAMEPYSGKAQVLFPGHEPGDDGGLSMEGLTAVASSVPRAGAVLFLGFRKDNSGERVSQTEAVQRIVERSVGPVYVLSDEWLGQGVLGGVVLSGREQGEASGGVVLRLLAGERAQGMLPESVEPQPVVDLTIAAQFGIGADRISPETLGINAPQKPEEHDSADSTGFAAIMAALLVGVAIFLLLRQSASRKDT